MIFFIDTAFDITKLAIKKENSFYEETIDANTNISQVLIDRTKIILDKSRSKKKDIKLIIFNQGPGNFTSLRVALAYIKAMAFYINIPIITLNSFQILALSANKNYNEYPLIVAIDARMNEVYYVEYTSYSDIFVKGKSYSLFSYEKFYGILKNTKKEKISIIKNSDSFLSHTNNYNNSIVEKIISPHNINIPNILKAVEKNFLHSEENIDKVCLLYIRNNVAQKYK
ncbi:MAG: tRNA (adenosine(37)-N6)-threonylcarbamoyltransferase complex dimerization subunit type 1 TsaB [Gammaproteobacteria bacterium]|jgi:tRNA threonylcarbamoyl adenosine modification protein YeaZ|nr:tRNA (adenosine(37)-N6)-threonylcarbamoyltransferase complex dimerization subunit type 1 TsaB [Gammaproteobacteria bacterium]MBT6754960.1 tRNA (adenosine(37)-N6)-threonylcarbamoyltransferase complex dimerization subunit type 1 TsaB [Gammaproteobacteria bacterium]MBT7523971.1 tRNA (adenosine(37)-N6)-threonylcarbamoyltransferase complex dimerization subunit type 1 TsaB [Gammaproteobacteria bacterium]MBT7814908.1 tRNA (adenosine(37)-N6)-threonylcarbamoyltransferase complex dimerization subunit t|tara:strand:- start:1007 stop:1687 length:681 start_codon:yes stop_codon:yes gene_type:complete